MLGMTAEQSSGILGRDCDYWEVAGVDFVELSNAIFTFKDNWETIAEHSTDNWYVHNNRVYMFYRESGMQFNGDNNRIENNEIYKVTNRVDTPYGCTLLNLLGDHNQIKGNTLSRSGSTADCTGILFEWDLADMNTVERNKISDVYRGVDIEGGDNNMIKNNIISAPVTPSQYAGGIQVMSYDNMTGWPCDEAAGSAQSLLPANDPSHPDYQYYYSPRNCYSYANQIYNNNVTGFVEGVRIYQVAGENTIIRNNIFSGWKRGSICFYNSSDGTCKTVPSQVTADHNQSVAGAPIIDVGYNLGSLNTTDFNGNIRPKGLGFDIGAYEK